MPPRRIAVCLEAAPKQAVASAVSLPLARAAHCTIYGSGDRHESLPGASGSWSRPAPELMR
jgi:hypothetical protein